MAEPLPTRGGIVGSYIQDIHVRYGSHPYTRNEGGPSSWFGPLEPLDPIAPPEVAGRQWDFPAGYNLQTRPRIYEPITFKQLRAMADGLDVLRLVIETRKDQIGKLKWVIRPRDEDEKPDAYKSQIKTIREFFRKPDREHNWDDWLRLVLEDLFVIDAPTLYIQRTRGGKLNALFPLDGGTIKPVIDDWGRTPQPPDVAYQQILKGYPAVD